MFPLGFAGVDQLGSDWTVLDLYQSHAALSPVARATSPKSKEHLISVTSALNAGKDSLKVTKHNRHVKVDTLKICDRRQLGPSSG